MSKSIHSDFLLMLPSGIAVHPCRLIHRDGTLMWKHAFLYHNEIKFLPKTQAEESHIEDHEVLEQRDPYLFFKRC